MGKEKNDLSCHIIKHTVKKTVIKYESTINSLGGKTVNRLESADIFSLQPTVQSNINKFTEPFKYLNFDICTLADKLIF